MKPGSLHCRLCPYQQVCRWSIRRAQNVPFRFTPSTPSSRHERMFAPIAAGFVLVVTEGWF